jgi:uncharacterized membrane protein
MSDPGTLPPSAENSKLKIDPNLAGALCYLFGCISGILFFVLETDNKRVRFHALQSILLFTSLSFLQIGSIFMAIFTDVQVFSVLNGILGLAYFVLWLIMVIRTYQGHDIKLPVIGDFAQKTVGWP